MSKPKYTSRGTLRYKLSMKIAGGPSKDDEVIKQIIFTPVKDYSVKRDDKNYAIFLSSSGDSQALSLEYKESGIDISLRLLPSDIELPLFFFADNNQVQVEIEIIHDTGDALELVSITIPGK